MKSNIDQLFQDKLKNFQHAPSNEVWNQLEPQLGELKTQKRVTTWKWVRIAASIFLFLIAGYQFYHSRNSIQSNTSIASSKDTLTICNPKKIISPNRYALERKIKNKIYKNEISIKNNSKLIAQSDSNQKQDATFASVSSSSKKSITIEITIEEKNYVSMDQSKEKKKWINKTIRFLTRLKKAEVSWDELSLKNKNKNEESEK